MKAPLLLSSLLLFSEALFGQSAITSSFYIHQGGMYYTSGRITSDGYGGGIGYRLKKGDHLTAQSDLNIFWGNGNAFSARMAAGYQKKGKWNPEASVTLAVMFGSRTEILSESGDRPDKVIAVPGIRIAPLRFENNKGFVSALETGIGIGPDHGKYLEIMLFTVGVGF